MSKSWLWLPLTLLLAACGGPQAPGLSITPINDQPGMSLSSPGKPVLLNFWATSCPSCIEEIPGLVALQQQFGNRLAVVGVAMGYDDLTQVRQFMTQRQLPYAIAHDADQAIAKGFGNVYVTPTNILLSADGQIVWRNVGAPDFSALATRIEQLTSKP